MSITLKINEAASEVGLTPTQIIQRTQDRIISKKRQKVFLILHERHGWGFSMIGRHLKRSHATVYYGIRKARGQKNSKPEC